jgi:hypothetical protein
MFCVWGVRNKRIVTPSNYGIYSIRCLQVDCKILLVVNELKITCHSSQSGTGSRTYFFNFGDHIRKAALGQRRNNSFLQTRVENVHAEVRCMPP